MLAQLGQEFENRRVRKCYLAVVRGWPDSGGTISHSLLPSILIRHPGTACWRFTLKPAGDINCAGT